MNLFLIANIIAGAGALGSFLYGAFRFLRPRAAVYCQMITLAAGVTVFGRLYQIIRLLTVGEILERFHLGNLSTLGSLLFLFTANYGLMDSLVDDRSPGLRKYRIIPLIVPPIATAIYLAMFLFSDQPIHIKIIAGEVAACVAAASYYNLKHLIIPDVEFGIIRSLRQYNLFALIYEFLCLDEFIMLSRDYQVGLLVVCVLIGIVLPLIVISVDRGVRKWST